MQNFVGKTKFIAGYMKVANKWLKSDVLPKVTFIIICSVQHSVKTKKNNNFS